MVGSESNTCDALDASVTKQRQPKHGRRSVKIVIMMKYVRLGAEKKNRKFVNNDQNIILTAISER